MKTIPRRRSRPERATSIDPQQYFRQLDFYNPVLSDPRITVIGAGGIGSFTVPMLSLMGVRSIRVIDPDRVAPHNLSTTPYTAKDLGKRKVVALQRVVLQMGGRPITVHAKWYKGGKLPKTDILISSVDSMDARRLLFKAAKDQKIPFFIDGRIGGEHIRVYAIQPGKKTDRAFYQQTLLPNSRVAPLPCTRQQIIFVGSLVSGLITRAVQKWVAEGRYMHEIIWKSESMQMIFSKEHYATPAQDAPPGTIRSLP